MSKFSEEVLGAIDAIIEGIVRENKKGVLWRVVKPAVDVGVQELKWQLEDKPDEVRDWVKVIHERCGKALKAYGQ